jgi:hypothetical protein
MWYAIQIGVFIVVVRQMTRLSGTACACALVGALACGLAPIDARAQQLCVNNSSGAVKLSASCNSNETAMALGDNGLVVITRAYPHRRAVARPEDHVHAGK